MIDVIKAILIGIVQGITEWLPVSSTGHMILFEEFVKINTQTKGFWEFFLVVIQLGSILAVCVAFFERLNPFAKKKSDSEKKATWRFWGLVLIGCLPAGIVGVLLDDWLDAHFYNFYVVAGALLFYGILFVILERLAPKRRNRVETIEKLSLRDALLIGGFQVLSLIPGTSRSGSTILGASLIGVGRTAAAEFSFFMALPIMTGATLLRGYKFFSSGMVMLPSEILILCVGVSVAFLVSLFAIRFLMDFVRRHTFEAFGWYRIALGAAVLLYGLL